MYEVNCSVVFVVARRLASADPEEDFFHTRWLRAVSPVGEEASDDRNRGKSADSFRVLKQLRRRARLGQLGCASHRRGLDRVAGPSGRHESRFGNLLLSHTRFQS